MAIISLQSSASALSALNTSMDVIANNLANVNTAGFKASRSNFQDLLYMEKQQPGTRNSNGDERPIGLAVGLGTKISGTQLNFEQGALVKGNNLDVAIQGNGFFRVQVEPGLGTGGLAYTRNGQFTQNSDGELVLANSEGRRLEPNIVIPSDVIGVSIGADGIVSVTREGNATPEQIGQISLTNFVNPAGLRSVGGNLFVESEASGPAVESNPGEGGAGTLLQGQYENSNVDPTTELIHLIRVQRAFEMNSNTIRAADETLRNIAQLRR